MGRGPVSSVQHISAYGATSKDKEIIKLALGVTPGTNLRNVDLHQLNYHRPAAADPSPLTAEPAETPVSSEEAVSPAPTPSKSPSKNKKKKKK